MNERVDDPGLGTLSKDKAQRFVTPDGKFNITHLNKKKSLNEAYTYLIGVSWPRFFVVLFAGFTTINIFFASVYVSLGVQNLKIVPKSFIENLFNASFFSVQTLTTLGYGYYSPQTILTGFVSSIEAILGLITFAFITGLLYGRFSKPKVNIRFSDNILYCKHKGENAIMFRLISRKKALIINPTVRVSLSLGALDNEGKLKNNFFTFSLVRDTITYMPTTWTLVHIIDESSPLSKFTKEEIKKLQGELLILFSYHDELYNQELHQVHSYIFENLKFDHVFKKAYYYNDEGKMVLDHNLLNATEAQSL